ncbi:MAG: type I-E CRISPR-associated protein Cse2/CasB [Candidatus Hinthialibacter antarcticus]|nr:type I-E CRISPR-associated protein Cse2/CasB [Candidatus Hinthialibacter antarcticus]
MPSDRSHPFIDYLLSLKQQQNRGALAHLRRGLGKPPGTVADVYPYVGRFLGDKTTLRERDEIYLVASLFALHDEHQTIGNLGASFHSIWMDAEKSSSLEKRFVNLLNANREELPGRLRHAVSLLKSKGVGVDYAQLLDDLRWWDSDRRTVQEQWARSFWAYSKTEDQSNEN